MLKDRLKALTKPFHDEVETGSLTGKIVSKTITKDEYATLLMGFYAILKPLEQLLLRSAGSFAKYSMDIEQRKKVHLIEADLANLGFSGEIHTHTFENKSFEWLIGASYVYEGSTMGGMFLSKELSQMEFAKSACTYFTPYGAKTMQMWQEFGEFLARVEDSGELDVDLIILSACENFLLVKKEIVISASN